MTTPAVQKLRANREELVAMLRERIERMKHIHPSQGLDPRDVVTMLDGFLYLLTEYPEQERQLSNEKM